MSKRDPEAQLENFISVGAAYAEQRDTRTVMGMIFTAAMTAAAATIALYATIADVWDAGVAILLALVLAAAVFGALVPWAKLKREWQLSMFWIALVLIDASVYVLDVPTMALLILLPMMGLTYWFGRDRSILISHMLGAIAAFALPVITGESEDSASALIITLPAMIAVAALSGVLADRFHIMRSHERGRYKATIEALSTALTARDGYTGSHSQETLWFVRAVAEELRLSSHECEYVADVALLHDIGKIGIPNEVLHEPGRLNEEQWEIMKQHPVIGEKIVKTIPGLEEVARAIRHEHEHWNGGGYPDGLRQGEIPLASRIVLVCDAFHAMTSDRPYRQAMSVSEARLELSENAGTQFDPHVVGALLHVLDRREPGDNSVFSARVGESNLSTATG
jgi:HD-GYP domain-containing protein (c-di-GMP phosphodiesterase class II)